MTDILLNKGVQEHKDRKNCIYLLEDEEQFSQLGYKVMFSQKVPGLLQAAKIKHNGQTELIYLTQKYQTYINILPQLPRDGVFMVCSKVLDAILQVKNQGFLACENIDVSVDRIYFNPKTYEAYLVYLPLSSGDENEEARFEVATRHLLLQFIKQANAIVSQKEREIVQILTNGTVGLDRLNRVLSESLAEREQDRPQKHSLRLVSMDPNMPLSFSMNRPQMKIGRKKDNDAVVDFTTQISRLHCTVFYKANGYFIQDEGSSFGTGINGKKLPAKQLVQLHDGDVLMLPGIRFKVRIV